MSAHNWIAVFLILTVSIGTCLARTCPYCGVDNPDVAAFCKNCGHELHEEEELSSPVNQRAINETRVAADAAFDAKDWEKALEFYHLLLSIDPSDSAATYRILACRNNLEIVPVLGRAKILSDPHGAEVAVDGAVKGLTPLLDLELSAGTRMVSLKKRRHEQWLGSLEITAEGTSLLDVRLREKSKGKAFARSLILPGQGQRYRERPVMGWIYTAAVIGAAGVTAFMYSEYNTSHDEYENATDAYDNAVTGHDALWGDVQDKYDEVKKQEDNLQITLSVAVGVYALNLLDSLIF